MKMTQNKNWKAFGYAILAALLYGISTPVSKLLLLKLPATMMAACLYLGAGLGMLCLAMIQKLYKKGNREARLSGRDAPYVVGMILLDIAAPIFLMLGLTMTTAANGSLLNNFEIVATSVIALFLFRESIGRRMWIAIGFITLSSILLSITEKGSLSFSLGSFFVLLACVCWGFENNCTRMLSLKDPLQIVIWKGFGSGTGALIIAFFVHEVVAEWLYIGIALVLGFVAYGLSIFVYILAQRKLGAARTSAFYAFAPFIGVIVSWIVLKEPITLIFVIALIMMLVGAYFAVTEQHQHLHLHLMEQHTHKHNHKDGHHNHVHEEVVEGEHTHEHIHEQMEHSPGHLPDLHHRHIHETNE